MHSKGIEFIYRRDIRLTEYILIAGLKGEKNVIKIRDLGINALKR